MAQIGTNSKMMNLNTTISIIISVINYLNSSSI